MSEHRLILFTRYPTPGAAKTRLIPAIGPERAAALHRRLTERTVAVARAAGLALELRTTGAPAERFRDWLGDVRVVDQGQGGLGERLLAAAAPYPVMFIGADGPQLAATHLREAVAVLAQGRCAIGPAEDGGYWLIALPAPVAAIFEEVPWSTDAVFVVTMRRFAAAGIAPVILERLPDLDRPEDLARFPELCL